MTRTATNEQLRSALSDLLCAVESGVLYDDELPEPFAEPAEAARRALSGAPADTKDDTALPDEAAIEAWLRDQMESGCLLSEDLPRLMARYALSDPDAMRAEFAERMNLSTEEA